jgi:hypothetical protein
LDIDNLGPAPDLDNLDISKLDKGNDLPAPAPAPEPSPEPSFEKEEPVEEPAAEEEDKPARDDKGKFAKKDSDHIPKSRFNEAVGKERDAREAAQARVAELEAQLRQREEQEAQARQSQVDEQAREFEEKISELEKQHAKYLLDGDGDKAAEVMKTIRMAERQLAETSAYTKAQQAAGMMLEQDRMKLTIATLESEHPVLNPKSEEFDRDIVETILLWQAKGVEMGMSPSQALADSTERVMNRFYKTQPAPAAEGLSKAAESQRTAEERTKAAVEKAVAASKAQPAPTTDVGLDSDKFGGKGLPDVSRMSSDEYNALPETTRARLRGDLVA